MSSVEAEVKAQLARVFSQADWRLFKRMAEYYLERAVFLRKADVTITKDLRLLARNCQKRLFIGIGTELLLKAIYLKHGFSINKPQKGQAGAPAFPFTFQQAVQLTQIPDETYELSVLIDKLPCVSAIGQLDGVTRGLRIAKVFRNKEGHAVFSQQRFVQQNYRDIEASLVALYRRAFNQTLSVRFSLLPNEKGVWSVQ